MLETENNSFEISHVLLKNEVWRRANPLIGFYERWLPVHRIAPKSLADNGLWLSFLFVFSFLSFLLSRTFDSFALEMT